jgi:hypothetical protein
MVTVMAIYIIIFILVFAGMFIFVNSADSMLKLEKYNQYKSYIDQIEQCRTIPMILCDTWNEPKQIDFNVINKTK